MNAVAARIFETSKVTDESGEIRKLHSHTSLEQCEFIQGIIDELGAKTTLEVGLAYGISALFICEAATRQNAVRHYIIDPMQEGWGNTGLKNLREAGYGDLIDFRGDFSHNVLPALQREGVKLDFAYVDTTKVFDMVLVDTYFIYRMLRVGGVLLLDDCSFPGLRKLARLLAVHPGLEVYKTFEPEREPGAVKKALARICNSLPRKDRIFAPEFLKSDAELGVNAHCIGFRKIAEEPRNWDWSERF